MLSLLLRLHRDSPNKLGVREIIGAVYINIVAAHDVTAITLRTVFYHRSRSPAIHRKLYDEIAEADRLCLISYPARHSEVSSAPYLSAVINEALRIHPGFGTIPKRVVPQGGVELHGVKIPEGTIIGVHTWAINRSKDIFGEDIECFRPERWIDNAPEKLQSIRKNVFTWGAGARGCIGKNVAMLQK
ncbi:hypothetical protein EYC80_006377 [Monilinia laxa]|uniref:Cytochrome P450 n=1 Tax=Monilinia laxa TaxID=61186 RepID=A0A5N6JT86_MONLA|nr:hypothetical protein EYC80_006377 [Monilinia laxa]